MRGGAERQANIMLAVTAESFVPADHPIRRIKPIVDAALARLSPLLGSMYSRRGRPSIPPEHLLKASLLIALFSVRSERQFCEQLRYNLLFKGSTPSLSRRGHAGQYSRSRFASSSEASISAALAPLIWSASTCP